MSYSSAEQLTMKAMTASKLARTGGDPAVAVRANLEAKWAYEAEGDFRQGHRYSEAVLEFSEQYLKGDDFLELSPRQVRQMAAIISQSDSMNDLYPNIKDVLEGEGFEETEADGIASAIVAGIEEANINENRRNSGMRITVSQLRRIIAEEVSLLREAPARSGYTLGLLSIEDLKQLIADAQAELQRKQQQDTIDTRARLESDSETVVYGGMKFVSMPSPDESDELAGLADAPYIKLTAKDRDRFVNFYTRLTKTGARPMADAYAATASGTFYKYNKVKRTWERV